MAKQGLLFLRLRLECLHLLKQPSFLGLDIRDVQRELRLSRPADLLLQHLPPLRLLVFAPLPGRAGRCQSRPLLLRALHRRRQSMQLVVEESRVAARARRLLVEKSLGAAQDVRGQREMRREREGERVARPAHAKAIQRSVIPCRRLDRQLRLASVALDDVGTVRVYFHRGALEARVEDAEVLEAGEVRRRQDARSLPRHQILQDRLAQRRALERIGARPDLVQEHERCTGASRGLRHRFAGYSGSIRIDWSGSTFSTRERK